MTEKSVIGDPSSQTFSIHAGFFIQCFALSPNANQVIVTTKMASRLYQIEDEKKSFTLRANYTLKDTKFFCIRDLTWSRLDESLILSCGSNGELHKWKVTSNEFKPDFSIQTQQKHILNKVTCHPNDVNLVLSGGQDGVIELYDLRQKERIRHFKHDAEEKVTDIQVSPVSGSSQFASGSDIGHVYIWDMRGATNMKISKYKPHVHEVHLDWHPEERNWLATASKDRLIHFNSHSLSNAFGIGRKHKMETQTSYTNNSMFWLDRLKTPCVGLGKAIYFLWRNSPKLMIATAKEYIFNLSIDDALRPANHSTLVAINIDKYGSVAFAVVDDQPKPHALSFSDRAEHRSMCGGSYEIPYHPISTPVSNEIDSEPKFRLTQSKMLYEDEITAILSDWFLHAALNYRFKDSPFENLCDHNGLVALKYKKFSVYKDWMILKAAYKDSKLLDHNFADMKTSTITSAHLINENYFTSNTVQLRRSSDSSVLSYGQYFPDNSSTPDDIEPSNETFDNYKHDDDEDSSILPTDIIEFNEINDLFDDLNEKPSNQIDTELYKEQPTSPNSQSNNEQNQTADMSDAESSSNLVKDLKLNILTKYCPSEMPKLNFDQHFQKVLFNYINDENDLPTAITMFLVACRSGEYQKTNIDEVYLNEWFSQYIELLAKFELWNLRVDIIKSHTSEFMINLTQKSLNYNVMCAMCKKQIKSNTYLCPKCSKNPFLCSFCHLPVTELYVWCHTCFHGGHLNHLEAWFKKYNKCCTGCGCNCFS